MDDIFLENTSRQKDKTQPDVKRAATQWSTPGLRRTIMEHEFPVRSEAVEQIAETLIGTGREALVDIDEERIGSFHLDVFAHKHNDPRDRLRPLDRPLFLLHNRGVAHWF